MRQLAGLLIAYRIAQRRYSGLDGIGAAMYPQRWNAFGQPVVYAAQSLAVCQLELLVHLDRVRPTTNHVWIEIRIPEGVSIEQIDSSDLPGWSSLSARVSRRFGSEWLDSLRSAVLVVPSRAAGERGNNVLINPRHPEFVQITASPPRKMRWDPRLFGTTNR